MDHLTAVLLILCPLLTQYQEIKNVASSSDVTLGRCEDKKVFKIHHGSVTAHIPCSSSPMIPHKFQGRLGVDESTRLITLRSVTKSDSGNYTLERTNGNGERGKPTWVELRVLDPAWIHDLYRNNTDRTISFTVGNTEDLGTITWKMDAEDLLLQHWRSPDDRTLTIAYNHTGTIRVDVSNLVSADSKSITLLSALFLDLKGNTSHMCPIMYPNMTRLVWDEDGGHTDDRTLNLPRNVTNLCVLIPSDEMGEPESRRSRSRHHFAVIAVLVPIVLCVIIVVLLCRVKETTNAGSNLHEIVK